MASLQPPFQYVDADEKGQQDRPLITHPQPTGYSSMPVVWPQPVITNVEPRRSARRRACARTVHIILLLCLLDFFLFTFTPVFGRAGQYVSSLFGFGRHMVSRPPLPNDCYSVLDWKVSSDHPPHHGHGHQWPHFAETSVNLPLSADLLYFLSKGALAHGVVEVTKDGETTDSVTVETQIFYHSADVLDLAKVCLLHRGDSQHGVGIFSPIWRHSIPSEYRDSVAVKIRLPASNSPITIKSFETDMPLFIHHVTDLSDNVHFNNIFLQSSNTGISAEYITGDAINLRTSNSKIEGSFNTTSLLHLTTSNAPITVNVTLNDLSLPDSSKSPLATLQTSNGPIEADVSLISGAEDGTGGKFGVNAKTSNAPLSVNYLTSPVNSTLWFAAKTSNSPLRASLDPAYEGTIEVTTGHWFPAQVQIDRTVQDPSGENRERKIEQRQAGNGVYKGRVTWSGVGAKHLGAVQVSTSNAPATLYL